MHIIGHNCKVQYFELSGNVSATRREECDSCCLGCGFAKLLVELSQQACRLTDNKSYLPSLQEIVEMRPLLHVTETCVNILHSHIYILHWKQTWCLFKGPEGFCRRTLNLVPVSFQ
jgi:hypothetical protein